MNGGARYYYILIIILNDGGAWYFNTFQIRKRNNPMSKVVTGLGLLYGRGAQCFQDFNLQPKINFPIIGLGPIVLNFLELRNAFFYSMEAPGVFQDFEVMSHGGARYSIKF